MSIAKTLFVLSIVFPFFLLNGCSGGAVSAPAPPGSRYVLTDINPPFTSQVRATSSQANALNDQGQVVGWGSHHEGGPSGPEVSQSFLYSGGAWTPLPLFQPASINNAGQIVGIGGIYQNGALTDISKQIGLSTTNSAYPHSLNNAGQVVGSLIKQAIYPADHVPQGATTIAHAFSFQNGQATDLGTLGEVGDNNPDHASNSASSAVNDMGVIVGQSGIGQFAQTGHIQNHAFVYSSGKMTDLNTLGGDNSQALAINNQGQIVGQADTTGGLVTPPTIIGKDGQPFTPAPYYQSGPSHAVTWQNGVIQDLSTPSSGSANAINNAGQIVGTFAVKNGNHAFVYRDGKLQDLNSLVVNGSGWTLGSATGINTQGQICGYGTINGYSHAFLLTPK